MRASRTQTRALAALAPAGTAGGSRTGTLTNLQVLRAAAALAVLLYHASVYVGRRGGGEPLHGIFDGRFGLMGVAVFFALSGFLMARLVRTSEPWTFLAHRILRIFPAYLALAALFAALSPVLGLGIGLKILPLTLAPAGPRAYPLGIEWTLLFETTFYVALFGIALAGLARHLERLALAWLSLILAVWAIAPDLVEGVIVAPAHLVLLSPANIPFAGGLLLPWLIERRFVPKALVIVAFPLALLSGSATLDVGRGWGGLAAILLVAAGVQAPQLALRHGLVRGLARLGDWSYALYLVHVPVIVTILVLVPGDWPALVLWSVAVGAALAAASVVGPIEVASYRGLRAWADAARPATLRAFGAVYLAIFVAAAGIGTVLSHREASRGARAHAVLASLAVESPAAPGGSGSVATAVPAIPGGILGRIEDLATDPEGGVVLKAWAFAPAARDAELSLGAFCNGHPIGIRRASHRRPDLAALLGPDHKASARIGFTVPLRPGACEAIVAVVADDLGRVAVLPGTIRLPRALPP